MTNKKPKEKKTTLYVYTDGSCLHGSNSDNGTGCGGWAVVIVDPNPARNICFGGGETKTTVNRMELTAAYRAIQHVVSNGHRDVNINIWTDSEYVVGGIKNLARWKERGWATQSKTPLKNLDLWQSMEEVLAANSLAIFPHWVKGHNGHPLNELADSIARFNSKLTAAKLNQSHISVVMQDIDNSKTEKRTSSKATKSKPRGRFQPSHKIAFEPIPDTHTGMVW